MNAGFSAEIAVLGLSIGLLLSLVCYLVSNLSPGGMITPGWLALVVVEDFRRLALLGLVVVGTIFVMLAVRRVVILYGKRLFATVVMVAVFLQMTAFFILIDLFPSTLETTTLGFIVPGLIAYQLIRQPVVATLGAIAAVTALSYGVMLAGVVFNLIPGLVAPTFSSGNIQLTPLRVGFILVAVLLGFVGVGIQMRRVRRPSMAPMAGRSPRSAAATREAVRSSEEEPLASAAPASSVASVERPAVVVPAHPPQPAETGDEVATGGRLRSLTAIGVVLAAVLLFVAGVAVGRAAAPEEDAASAASSDNVIDPGPVGSGSTPAEVASKPDDGGDIPEVGRYPERCLRAIGTQRDGLAVTTVKGTTLVDLRSGGTIRTPLRGTPAWSPSGRWVGSPSGEIVGRAGNEPKDLFSAAVSRWMWAPSADCAIGSTSDSLMVTVPGGTERVLLDERPGDVVFSPKGDELGILTEGNPGRLIVLDLRARRSRKISAVPVGSDLLTWSSRGLLVTSEGRLLRVTERGVTKLGRAEADRVIDCGRSTLVIDDDRRFISEVLARGPLVTVARGYRGAVCSPDGRFLAAVSSAGRLTLLDPTGGFHSQLDVRVPARAVLAWGQQGLSIAIRQSRTVSITLLRPGRTATETVATLRVHTDRRLHRLVDRANGASEVSGL